MSEFKYKDILNYEYPNPEIERDFSDKIIREAQFAPFAALTGYDDAIAETARLTDSKIELDEYAKEELDRKLKILRECTEDKIYASITYFLSDAKKEGGRYVTKYGIVVKVREYEKDVIYDDGVIIPIDDILAIEIDDLNKTKENE